MEVMSRILLVVALFFLGIGEIEAQLASEMPDSLRHPDVIDSAYCSAMMDFSDGIIFSKPDLALEVNSRVVEVADSLDNVYLKGRGRYGVAVAYTVMSENLESINWLDTADYYFLLVDDSSRYYKSQLLRGVNLNDIGHFTRSLNAYRGAFDYFLRHDKTVQVARVANNIGNIYFMQENYEPALKHYHEALRAGTEVGNDMLISVANTNLGNTYLDLDSLELAESYLQTAYDFNIEKELVFAHASTCNRMADLKLRQGKFEETGKFLDEAMETARGMNDESGVADAYLSYGELYTELGDEAAALAAYDSASFLASKLDYPEVEMDAEELKAELLEKRGDFQGSLAAHKKSIAIRDSIFGEKKVAQLEELTALHSMERRQQEIQQLKEAKELQDQLVSQQKWFIGGLAIALVAALTMVVIAFVLEARRRVTNKQLITQNARIASQQEEIVQQNEVLSVQNQHLENLNAEMEGLIEIVAHYLKSPITKSQALVAMIEENGAEEGERPYLAMISKVLGSGLGLIQDILTVRRIESGANSGNYARVEMGGLVKEVCASFSAAVGEKRINLNYIGPEEAIEIETDSQAVMRILENLISNAVKFSNQDTEVNVELTTLADGVELTVRDQGPGISEEDQKRMFRKFQRLTARPTAGESSTGLGLSIVKALVNQLGGDIRVESKLGEGACFIFNIPYKA